MGELYFKKLSKNNFRFSAFGDKFYLKIVIETLSIDVVQYFKGAYNFVGNFVLKLEWKQKYHGLNTLVNRLLLPKEYFREFSRCHGRFGLGFEACKAQTQKRESNSIHSIGMLWKLFLLHVETTNHFEVYVGHITTVFSNGIIDLV